MKKLIIVLMLALFSIVSYSQERERSDYEKYRLEQDAKDYPPEEEVFFIVEDMPKFNGEDAKEFRNWITLNVEYPSEAVKNNIQGKVIVSFVVNSYGNVVNAKVEKSIDPYLDAEAIRVVEISPKWIPGKQRNKAVSVQFTFPINFVLDAETAQEQSPVINNYYIDAQPDYRRSLYFGYNPYFYGHYDSYYYGGWYGYNSYYYGSYYPYWGYNRYYNGYYGHNHNYWNYGYYSRPRGKYYTNSNGYYRTYKNGYVNPPTARKKNVRTQPITTRAATQKTNYRTADKSNYSPTYSKPRTTRSEYNRSATRNRVTTQQKSTRQKSTTVRTPVSTNRSSSTYSRPTQSQSRSYRAPSTAPSRSYSAPSRSYSAPAKSSSSYSRSSSSSRSSASYSRSSSSGSSRSSGSRGSSTGGGKKR